jgi:hypothetical protein
MPSLFGKTHSVDMAPHNIGKGCVSRSMNVYPAPGKGERSDWLKIRSLYY